MTLKHSEGLQQGAVTLPQEVKEFSESWVVGKGRSSNSTGMSGLWISNVRSRSWSWWHLHSWQSV